MSGLSIFMADFSIFHYILHAIIGDQTWPSWIGILRHISPGDLKLNLY